MVRNLLYSERKGRWLFIGTCTFAMLWLATWLAGLVLSADYQPIRFRLSGILFTLTVGTGALFVQHLSQLNSLLQRCFETIHNQALNGSADDALGDACQPLPSGRWRRVATGLVECLREMQERVKSAELSRATGEVRARRFQSRCEHLETILGSLVEPVLVVDQFDELVLANASARRLLGLPSGSLQKRAFSQLLTCEKLVDLLTDTRRRRGVAQRTGEIELPDGDQQLRTFSVMVRTLAAPDDAAGDETAALQGAVAVLRDISSTKAAQKRNAEFVSAVSHEMKTPLSGIKAYVELLVDGDAEDEATREEFLHVIEGQANRLQRLIDNLLNLARIEAGVVQVSKQPLSLNELLEETLDVVRPAAEAKQITLSGDLSNMYLGVLVDRDMMVQAAINLLSNAIKYTPVGGRVTLRSRIYDDQAVFSVEDTGVGLSEDDQVKVFEKFYRVKKDREMAGGTGLGLPLALHIVEDVHGGSLSVQSTLGCGSTFTVELPVAAKLQMA